MSVIMPRPIPHRLLRMLAARGGAAVVPALPDTSLELFTTAAGDFGEGVTGRTARWTHTAAAVAAATGAARTTARIRERAGGGGGGGGNTVTASAGMRLGRVTSSRAVASRAPTTVAPVSVGSVVPVDGADIDGGDVLRRETARRVAFGGTLVGRPQQQCRVRISRRELLRIAPTAGVGRVVVLLLARELLVRAGTRGGRGGGGGALASRASGVRVGA
mmetsp:Transcript_2142/g.6771  ORF Transcript_2142/g.6771 Transcript_2142/m.6771 type:complete len:218 (+) Transcript_2142:3156-3809(+)